MTNGWVDIKNTDMMLIMGGNPAENHPCGFKWPVEAKRVRNAKMIVVDPRFTRTAAVADVRVNRGSTEISLALRFRLASIAHLKPHGWFSAGLPPMINIMSVFLMSIQPLVIAPRPNVGPKLETVGPCQTRAWFSR